MKIKEIILLFFIVVAGVFFYHAQTGQIHFDVDWEDGFFFAYEEFLFEESLDLEPPFPPEIQIINAHGDVEIQGTDAEKITIFFQKEIWQKTEDQARDISDELKMIFDKYENQWIISTNRKEFRRKKFNTNFKITLPFDTNVDVKNSYGRVRVSNVKNTNIVNHHGQVMTCDIKGELFIQNSYKDVEVQNAQSDCQVESKHSSIFMNQIKGKTKISHRYGKINLENISQDVHVKGPYTDIFGQNLTESVEIDSSYRKIILVDVGPIRIKGHHSTIEVDGAKEQLGIENKYGKAKLLNIRGDLKVEGKNMSVYAKSITAKKIFVSSSYRDVEISDFSGETTILLEHGGIILAPSPLTHPIHVNGEYADIKFFWPSGGKYPIEARAKNGAVKWELPEEIISQEENGVSIIKAFLKEETSPSVFLSTTYGTIRIEK